MASAMPVLPDVGSRMTLSGVRAPERSASSIMRLAMRSFSEPVGFWPSSFAHRRTSGFGLRRGMPTSGVFPIASRMSFARMAGRLSQGPGRVPDPAPVVGFAACGHHSNRMRGSVPEGLLADAEDAVALVERQRLPAVEWETTMEAMERLASGVQGMDPAAVEAAGQRLGALARTRAGG